MKADAGVSGWTPPERLEEYRIIRPLGRGSMGQVYLAEDEVLARPVAVKFIAQRRPDADARRRFLLEARSVAGLSHANVVAVHRAGEVDGRQYIVTELVRGRSLAELSIPVPADQVLTIGLGIARGLAAAHHHGVLHRDVKPENVMLADDGTVKLLDFGLAKIADISAENGTAHEPRSSGVLPIAGDVVAARSRSGERSTNSIAGTPLYMAPESLIGDPATRRSDVYAAGAVLYELCAGVAPRDTLPADVSDEAWIAANTEPLRARSPGVDSRLAAVVDRCLAHDPAQRFASADALGDALAAIVPDLASAALPEGNPYRGLTPFTAEHRAVFFGRASETRAVLDRIRANGLVVVAGDSGVGKSSLCRAGVLPLLTEGGVGDGRVYQVAALVPGRHPMGGLMAALALVVGRDEAELGREVEQNLAALARAVRRALGTERGLIVFVDQLEELVTLADVDEASVFAQALARLPMLSAGVRVLATVRGDFFTRLATLPGFGEEIAPALYLLRPLSPEGLRAAITGPAARMGVTFEPAALVDRLAVAAGTAGGLPLLQFALSELWEARGTSTTIDESALVAIGGVEGALARHADDVLVGLSAEARAAARRVLLRLVTASGTRQRRTEAELGTDQAAVRTALDALVRGRLVVGGESKGEAAYEIAHEALLEKWSSLRGWLDETHEMKAFSAEIEEAAELWARRGRRREETWSDEALGQAAVRVNKAGLDLPPVSRAFLDAGLDRQRAERRRQRWLRGAGAGMLAVLALASTTAAVAFREKEHQAIRQQDQIRLAAADTGDFEIVLEPFDWDADQQRATPAAVPATLDFRLHAISTGDSHAPGAAYDAQAARRSGRRIDGSALRERIEVRSGPAFLEVIGRGDGCAATWIYLQRLPGYTDRITHAGTEVRLPIPSCQATRASTVVIPAGQFFRNFGAPDADHGPSDEVVDLPEFSIDRTEVTRGAFGRYASIEALTGDAAARASFPNIEGPGGDRLPIVGVDSFTAARYCRFLGKELPSVDQWQKAMRGGLTVNGQPNPDPKRLKPWSFTSSKRPANINYDDNDQSLAPVGSFPEDTSPYGVVDLAGNVSEWSRMAVDAPELRGLRFILGAGWGTPPTHAGWRNKKPDRYLDFGIGIRCVLAG